MDDRERVAGLVGGKVAVRLNSVEARGAEIVATLEEARDDGIVLSEVGELGPGPTMFCPWDSRRGEADGEVEVRDLPQTGALEVEVTRLASLGFDEEAGEELEEDSCDGPWTFEITI